LLVHFICLFKLYCHRDMSKITLLYVPVKQHCGTQDQREGQKHLAIRELQVMVEHVCKAIM